MAQNAEPRKAEIQPEAQIYKDGPLWGLTLAGGLAGLLLRLYMGLKCYDESGLLHNPCLVYTFLWILTLAVLGALFWFARGMGSDSRFRRSYSPSTPAGIAHFLAALCLLVYSVSCLGAEYDSFHKITAVLGILACGCLVVMGIARLDGKRSAFLFPLICCIFLACRMFCESRFWWTDPEVADYCFQLLANAAGMLAAFHVAGYSLGHGQRRRSLFFCLACIYFSLVSLGHYKENLSFHLGLVFWMLGVTPRMKKPQRRRRPGGQIIPTDYSDDFI